ncbi:hypothetical protein [Streptomyces atroolivaceus]|uniref:hypothetical protein n=1 Tax=Streptomyces atroolivaceus TaxID=66869 RepID=UPI00202570CC|nr:hypothetical protein [Streptomyces atroolivaceus]
MPQLSSTERRHLVRLYAREHILTSERLCAELAWQRRAHQARDVLRRRCVVVATLVSTACCGFALFALQTLTTR